MLKGGAPQKSDTFNTQTAGQTAEQVSADGTEETKHNPILSRINHRHEDSLCFVCFGCFDIAAGEVAAWEAVVARRQCVFSTNQAGGNTRC